MFTLFKRKISEIETSPLLVDVHSHLLPGLDDGVKTFEEAENIILHFQRLGYKEIITTPHVMSDLYRNTNEGIQEAIARLRHYLADRNIEIEIKAGAEYYLDEYLVNQIEENKPLLTFGEKFLLFETNFLNEPLNLKDFIFLATRKGFRVVLAHPERYLYLQENFEKAEDLINRGVLFQMNISSITGYYSKVAQQMANKLIDRGWVHFLGSDCHNARQVKLVEEAQQMKYFRKALTLPLLNNSLR